MSEKIFCSCIICKKIINFKGVSTHCDRIHGTLERRSKYRSGVSNIKCSCIYCKKEYNYEKILFHYASHFRITNICPVCNILYHKKQKYCSRTCAAKASNANRPKENRILQGERLKKRIKNGEVILKTKPKYSKFSYCIVCGKTIQNSYRKTCSSQCLSISHSNSGKASANVRVTRSKLEVELYELCKSHFKNVDNNIPLVNGWDADIVIYDIKTAVLWNGPWHYTDMPGLTHSLKQVQNRDKIKIKELKSEGWNVVSFNDNEFTPLMAFNKLVLDSGVEPSNNRL